MCYRRCSSSSRAGACRQLLRHISRTARARAEDNRKAGQDRGQDIAGQGAACRNRGKCSSCCFALQNVTRWLSASLWYMSASVRQKHVRDQKGSPNRTCTRQWQHHFMAHVWHAPMPWPMSTGSGHQSALRSPEGQLTVLFWVKLSVCVSFVGSVEVGQADMSGGHAGCGSKHS